MSGKITPDLEKRSLSSDFKDPSSSQVEDIHEFEHKIALRFPQQLSRKQFQLQFILDHFTDLGVLEGGARTRNLVSHYFDTEEADLYKQGLALRVRYEEDPKTGVSLNMPDVSIKDKGFEVSGTTLREEYEAKLDTFVNGSAKPIMSLRPMIKKYGDDWAKRFRKMMSLNFKDYREIFSINCKRTTFKVCLFSVPSDPSDPSASNAQPFTIKPESELTDADRKVARKMIFEFALDANRFFVPERKEKVAKDYEIEFELKTHDCEYDPDPASSDHGITLQEAMGGRDWIRDHVETLLDERGLTPIAQTGWAKSERGEHYRRAKGYNEPCFDELTLRGQTDTFYTSKAIAKRAHRANDNSPKQSGRKPEKDGFKAPRMI
jgi:hypothetical protein